jgi:hypothetical protein
MAILTPQSDIPAGTPGSPQGPWTVPAGGGTFNLLACNRNSSGPVNWSCAIVANGGSLANGCWIEYQTPIGANQMWERGGIPLEAGATIYVAASGTGMSFTAAYMPGI